MTKMTVGLSASPVRKASKQVGGVGEQDTLSKLISKAARNNRDGARELEITWLETTWAFSEGTYPHPILQGQIDWLGSTFRAEI